MAWYDDYIAGPRGGGPSGPQMQPLDTSNWSQEARNAYAGAGNTITPQAQPQPAPSSGGGGDVRAAINEYLARYPGGATREAYEGIFPYLQQRGFNVQRPTRAGGTANSDDKIVLPDGSVIDLVMDVGPDGSGRWGWSHNGYWVDGRPSATPGVYTPFSNDGGGAGGSAAGTLSGLGYAAGSGLAPWTRDFNSPSAQQVQNHPGFQYALDRAQQGIERGAASQGTLLTGGLQARLGEHLQNMGMQQYGTLRDFMRDDYMIDRQNFMDNQDRPLDRLSSLAALGRPT